MFKKSFRFISVFLCTFVLVCSIPMCSFAYVDHALGGGGGRGYGNATVNYLCNKVSNYYHDTLSTVGGATRDLIETMSGDTYNLQSYNLSRNYYSNPSYLGVSAFDDYNITYYDVYNGDTSYYSTYSSNYVNNFDSSLSMDVNYSYDYSQVYQFVDDSTVNFYVPDDNHVCLFYEEPLATTYINFDVTTMAYSVYNVYYQLPNGANSYNLSVSDLKGQYFISQYLNYEEVFDDENLLALYHFDGNYENSVPNSQFNFDYDSQNFVVGKFDGGLQFSGSYDAELDFPIEDCYTMDFWFYNALPSTYTALGSNNAWVHCAYVYDNGSVRRYFNGRLDSTVVDVRYKDYLPCFQINGTGVSGGINPSYSVGYSTNLNSLVNYKFSSDRRDYPSLIWYLPYQPYTVQYLPFGSPLNLFESYKYSAQYSYYSSFEGRTLYDTLFNSTGYTGSPFGEYSAQPYRYYHQYPFLSDDYVEFGYTSPYHSSYYADSYLKGVNENLSLDATSSHTLGGVFDNVTWKYSNRDWRQCINMGNCIIDELRVVRGDAYDGLTSFVPPYQPYNVGSIFVPPSDNVGFGSVAFQTSLDINSVRVGGAIPSFPVNGDVYISLDGAFATSCNIYYNGGWTPIDFAIYDGTIWQNGFGFNWNRQTFDSIFSGNGSSNIDVDINLDVDFDIDEQKNSLLDALATVLELIVAVFASIGSFISLVLPFPLWVKVFITLFIVLLPSLLVFVIIKSLKK